MPQTKIRVVLGLKDIFDKVDVDVLELLAGYDPNKILLLIANINYKLSNKKNDREILKDFFKYEQAHDEYLKVWFSLDVTLSGTHNIIFNEKTNNRIIAIVISNYTSLRDKNSTKGYLKDFLLAYLKLNETTYGDDNNDIFSQNVDCFGEFSQILFFSKIYDSEAPPSIVYSYLRIKSLFNYYLRNHPDILQKFFDNNQIKDADTWISKLITLIKEQNTNELHFLNFESSPDHKNYLSKILMNKNIDKPINITLLRKYPVFQIEKDFLILNWNYLIKGIYYKINGDLFNLYRSYIGEMTYPDYKSIMSKKISEDIMFRYIVKKLIKSRPSITKVLFDTEGISLDAYIRIGNRIFIMEFKDYDAELNIMESYNLEEIKKYLDKNFVTKKGVNQISNFINNFSSLNINDEKISSQFVNTKDCEVIPIIVVSEQFFAVGAIENYLAKELTKQVTEHSFKRVCNLVVLSIDEIITFLLLNQKDDFFKLVYSYAKTKKIKPIVTIQERLPKFRFNEYKHTKSILINDIYTDFKVQIRK